MAKRLDHHRHTLRSKLRLNAALLVGGIGILPVARLLCTTSAGATFGAPLFVAGPILIGFALLGMLYAFLERHIDIKCPTCGQVHQVEWGVHSFLCTSCGARVGSIPSGYGDRRGPGDHEA